ncbi:ACP S-malonyltransferase [Actinoplanes sp. CA-252034]|uniref:ACP S-malonyltransferase n=1 Tax=Actinoplanes sp. CA-252034 TaxID=3239906 RepID=UPI003D99B4BC
MAETAVAALFPGVGSQYSGMGRDLSRAHRIYRDTLTEASDVTGTDIVALCQEPDHADRLNRQENAQLCLLAASVATYRVLTVECGVRFAWCAGHSLGEYSALCSAGVLSFADGLRLVAARARLIRSVADGLDGTMMWVIGLDMAVVDNLCAQRRAADGIEVYVSAHDAPLQGTISGRTADLRAFAGDLEARGAVVYPLRMEGPYHSPMMRPAVAPMAELLDGVAFGAPTVPVLSTVDGGGYDDPGASAARLRDQLVSPVRWLDVQRRLARAGAGSAIEAGPGNVLSFLLAKAAPQIRAWPVDREPDLPAFVDRTRIGPDDYAPLIRRCLRVAASTRTRVRGHDGETLAAPYRRLSALCADTERRAAGRADAEQALHELSAVLAARGADVTERRRQLNRALDGKTWQV